MNNTIETNAQLLNKLQFRMKLRSIVGWDAMQWNPSFKCLETSNAGITLRSIPAYGYWIFLYIEEI